MLGVHLGRRRVDPDFRRSERGHVEEDAATEHAAHHVSTRESTKVTVITTVWFVK